MQLKYNGIVASSHYYNATVYMTYIMTHWPLVIIIMLHYRYIYNGILASGDFYNATVYTTYTIAY